MGPESGLLIDWLSEIDSTNSELLRRAHKGAAAPQGLGADRQSAGRGRNGKVWDSATQGLYFSLDMNLACAPARAQTLSLVLGVIAAESIEEFAKEHGCVLPAVQLKWPNDLWLNDAKLGGILIEVVRVQAQALRVVAGIGINLANNTNLRQDAHQQTSRCDLLQYGLALSPRVLAARLGPQWLLGAADLARNGFAGPCDWHQRWSARDALFARSVQLSNSDSIFSASGIDTDGALQLTSNNGLSHKISAGEVTLSTRVYQAT